jgi:hypothetical protein
MGNVLRDIHDLEPHDFLHTKITPHDVDVDEGDGVSDLDSMVQSLEKVAIHS